ncbi:ADP-ribosyl-[dinitrogen reductase] hydrolase [Serratia marcescens]|uniref:ADP-ribosyl-[dinitrogen reductase] hydrolase n=1 Tax=Serratia marcescens TaxID=615 RepID=A0A379ZYA7_SERMA|nr:ADP-ribosyl-[dinitrogen reductase] hydrolase [Serratia marcescens]
MKQLTQAERIAGALYGQMLGDALGMPSELWPRERVKRHFGWIDGFLDGPEENSAACYFKAGQYTDDTAMALALADALREAEGEVVPALIARNVIRWVDSFDAFNKNILGPSSKLALSEQKAGTPIAELENNGITNGAAMRISPLGCVLPSAPLEDFCQQVWLASSPTHKSDNRRRRCRRDRLGGFACGGGRGLGLDSPGAAGRGGVCPAPSGDDVQPLAGGAHRVGVSGGG